MGWNLAGNIRGPQGAQGPAGSGGGDSTTIPSFTAAGSTLELSAVYAGCELQFPSAATLFVNASKLPAGAVGLLRQTGTGAVTITGTPALNVGDTWLGMFWSASGTVAMPSGWTVIDNTTVNVALAYHVVTGSETGITLPAGTNAVIQSIWKAGSNVSGAGVISAATPGQTGSLTTPGTATLAATGSAAGTGSTLALFAARTTTSGALLSATPPPGYLAPAATLQVIGQTQYAFLSGNAYPAGVPAVSIPVSSSGAASVQWVGYSIALSGSVSPAAACMGGSGASVPLPGGCFLKFSAATTKLAGQNALAAWRYDGNNIFYLNGELGA